MNKSNSRKANLITAALIASITILAACTDQTTPIVQDDRSITPIEVGKVATLSGVNASNECLQLATLTLNGYNSSITEEEELINGRCYRKVVSAWVDKQAYEQGVIY